MFRDSDDRYWSDYLRIALPVAGLLLLFGVFWYWANSFIGDDGDNPPATQQAQVQTTPITGPTATATISQAVMITPETAVPTTAIIVEDTPETIDNNAATEPASNGTGTFAEGDIIIVNDNDVNMRTEPSTSAEVVQTLTDGTELKVLSSEPTAAEDYTWWHVQDTVTGEEGWVVEDFLEVNS